MGEIGAHDVRDVVRTVGDAPNVAARVQSTAGDDEVVVTAQTRDLVRGAVRFESTGAHELKGVGQARIAPGRRDR